MKQFAVIRAGDFGAYLARHLYKKGHEVIAVKEIVSDQMNLIPTARYLIKDSDIMVLLGPNEELDKIHDIY